MLIQLRTNEEDKAKLMELAKEAGMTITDFVKSCTLNKTPRQQVAKPDRQVLIRLHSELGKIGSNVNQIAKVMNETKAYTATVKEVVIIQTLDIITTLSNHILKELGRGDKGEVQGERESVS